MKESALVILDLSALVLSIHSCTFSTGTRASLLYSTRIPRSSNVTRELGFGHMSRPSARAVEIQAFLQNCRRIVNNQGQSRSQNSEITYFR